MQKQSANASLTASRIAPPVVCCSSLALAPFATQCLRHLCHPIGAPCLQSTPLFLLTLHSLTLTSVKHSCKTNNCNCYSPQGDLGKYVSCLLSCDDLCLSKFHATETSTSLFRLCFLLEVCFLSTRGLFFACASFCSSTNALCRLSARKRRLNLHSWNKKRVFLSLIHLYKWRCLVRESHFAISPQRAGFLHASSRNRKCTKEE